MIIAEGHRQLSQVGFARFSAREVAKRIGYSIGTLYNVFGSYDRLILAINARTLEDWARYVETQLVRAQGDRLRVLIDAYFHFARTHRHAWQALYDHRLPPGEPAPDTYKKRLAALTGLIIREVAAALPPSCSAQAPPIARSCLATVHGHCAFMLDGTFDLLGEDDPAGAAYARICETIAAAAKQC